MGTTAQKLEAIQNSKAAIKSSLQTKFNKPEFNLTLNDKLADWSVAINNYGKTWKAKPRIQAAEFRMKYGAKIQGTNVLTNTEIWADRTIETVDLTDLSAVGSYGLGATFAYCPNLKTIIWNERHSLPNYTDAQGSTDKYGHMFRGCTGLSGDLSVDLSEGTERNAKSASFQYLFYETRFSTADVKLTTTIDPSENSYYGLLGYNQNLTKVVMRGLKNVPYASSGSTFGSGTSNYLVYSTHVSEIEFPDLEWVGYENSDGAYSRCYFGWLDTSSYSQRITLKFPKLRWYGIKGSSTNYCWFTGSSITANPCLEHIYLPSCVHLGQYAFARCQNITIHYAAANQAAIEACTGGPTFGSPSATVLYDL